MRRVLLAVALVVGLAALAQVVPFSLSGPIFRNPATMSSLGALPYVPDILWAPTRTYRTAMQQIDAGTGLPVAQELVDAFNTYGTKSGTWGTLRADGGSVAWDGGVWVAATGTSPPAQESPVVTPNGPSGGPVAAARTQYVTGSTGGQFGWEGTAHVPPSGAYTDCVHTALVAKDFQTIFAFSEIGAQAVLWQTQTGTTTVDIYTNGVNRRSVALTPGAPHVLCVTCSADQLTGQAYLDGVASGATFTCTTAAPAQTPRVSGTGNGAYPLNGSLFFGAFHTEAQLSAGVVSNISLATLASQPFVIRSDGGTANVIDTRATATSCDSSNGDGGAGGSILPPNRFCIREQGGRPWVQTQNPLVRADEIDNASWVKAAGGGGSVPTVTANYAVGPFGHLVAERVQTSACVADTSFSVVYQNYTGTAAAWVGAPYLRGTSGSGTVAVYFFDTTASTGAWVACPYVATEWRRCAPVGKTFANVTHRFGIGCNFNSTVFPGSSNTGAADVLVAAVQANAGTELAPYCPTTSGVATCDADVPVATVDGTPLAPLSLAGTRIGDSASSTAARAIISVRSAAIGEFRGYVPASGTAIGCRVDGGAAATTGTIDGEDDMDCKWDGTSLTACLGDSCAAPTTPGHAVATSTKVGIGVDPQNGDDQANGVVRDLRICTGAGGCTP